MNRTHQLALVLTVGLMAVTCSEVTRADQGPRTPEKEYLRWVEPNALDQEPTASPLPASDPLPEAAPVVQAAPGEGAQASPRGVSWRNPKEPGPNRRTPPPPREGLSK